MPEITTNTLQALIEKRAMEQLNKDVKTLISYIKSNPLMYWKKLRALEIQVPGSVVDDKRQWNKITFDELLDGYFLENTLREQSKQEYIDKFTNDFVNQIDSLKTKSEDLQSELEEIKDQLPF